MVASIVAGVPPHKGSIGDEVNVATLQDLLMVIPLVFVCGNGCLRRETASRKHQKYFRSSYVVGKGARSKLSDISISDNTKSASPYR